MGAESSEWAVEYDGNWFELRRRDPDGRVHRVGPPMTTLEEALKRACWQSGAPVLITLLAKDGA